MPYTPEPFQPFYPYDRQISTELLKANENFKILAQAFKDNDPNTLQLKYALYSDTAYPHEILSPLQIPYSRLFIQVEPPQDPQLFDSWYSTDLTDTSDFPLRYYNGDSWIEVDYNALVGYANNDGFPMGVQYFYSVGRVVEVMADDNEPVDDFKIITLLPGQSLVMRNKRKIRVIPSYRASYSCSAVVSTATKGVLGIKPDITGRYHGYGHSLTTGGLVDLGNYTNTYQFYHDFQNLTITGVDTVNFISLTYLPLSYFDSNQMFCSFTLTTNNNIVNSFSISGTEDTSAFTHGVLLLDYTSRINNLGYFLTVEGFPLDVEYAIFTRIR